jgi:hypothetical protein
VKGPEGTDHTWPLPLDQHSYRQVIDAPAGEVIRVPYVGAGDKPTRDELALFEVLGDNIRVDGFDSLKIKDAMLEVHGLGGGDYDLWLKKTGERIRIRVVNGAAQGRYVLGKLRYLELPALKPVQIASIAANADSLTIRLADFSPFTRVHVFATRYQPAFSGFGDLARVRAPELTGVYPAHAESVYLTGRNIGDEYRYVLDRRSQKKYAGNMLERPMLLLNPWAVRSTETGEQTAMPGQEYFRKGVPPTSEAMPTSPEAAKAAAAAATGDFADFDFLADASAVIVNLVPDKNGVVELTRKQIGPHAMIHVVAVDPLNTTSRSTTLPEVPAEFVDLRLRNGLDSKGHFTQQKLISVLSARQPFVLSDIASSRFEAYDSLAKVYGLYETLSHDPNLAEFAFLLNWPKLKPEEKRVLYSKYACHELHFFLLKKDPAFFQAVVRPYLANKKDKTFMDHWLLGEDLGEFMQPWYYGRLNTVERVLLAERIRGEPARTTRELNEMLRLQPPNVDRFLSLFDTAVKGGALEREDSLGLGRALREAPEGRARTLGRLGAGAMPAAPAPSSAMRGVGGMGGGGAKFGLQADSKAKSEAGDREAQAGAEKARDGRSADKDMAGKKPALRAELGLLVDGLAEREVIRQLYRRIEPTMEWAENNYYHLLIQQQIADLVPVSGFWRDYAERDGKGPFLSRNLAEASRNFTEMVCALAVLDLPFESVKHDVKFGGGRMTLTPANAIVAFHEEVRPVGPVAAQTPILISQNFYRANDRYREENGEKTDKFVTGEFVIETVYGCQVVVTNPTSAKQKLSVLLQVPIGAIPLGNGQFTKSAMFDLEPYRTQAIDYFFYFPLPGKFAHFPAQVAKNEKLIAAAAPATFDVVAKPSRLDTTSWEYVSQNGTNDEVLAFLERENVYALDLDKIAFRMKDRVFFTSVVRLLTLRHSYNATLWSYALLYNMPEATRQYLLHVDQIVNETGGPIRSALLTVDPVARHQYEHLEYKPLVNARAHSLGHRRQIVNARLLEQYERFLKLLSYHAQLSDEDRLAETYYLLLQDRIDEALSTFSQVNADGLATRLQYDYCSAYLALYGDDPQRARLIARRYSDYPVDRWKNLFAALLDQLEEAEGAQPKVVDAEDRNQRQGHLAATEPGFEFTLDNRQIHLTWQNIEQVRINYYLMDVELLFSRNPFVQEVSGPFASIRPNLSQTVKLPAGRVQTALALPQDLAGRNVLVEVSAAGKTVAHPYYANAMDVGLRENYGQLRVTDSTTSKPLSKVYVKVYARMADGSVKFHKDGYTDLRGRFDYATVSTQERQPTSRFAVLVLSDEHGALIRETAPPQQ